MKTTTYTPVHPEREQKRAWRDAVAAACAVGATKAEITEAEQEAL